VLVRLGNLVVRADPGTPGERVGTFDESFDQYLATSDALIDVHNTRGALLGALDTLAPPQLHDPTDPLHRYAAAKRQELQQAVAGVAAADRAAPAQRRIDPRLLLRQVGSVFERLTRILEGEAEAAHETRVRIALANYRLLLLWLVEQLREAAPQDPEPALISESIMQDIDRSLYLLEHQESLREPHYELKYYVREDFRMLAADTRALLRHLRRAGYVDPEPLDEAELAVHHMEQNIR